MPAPAAAPTLDALRHALDTVVERERPRDAPSLPTGLTALDVMLGGGLPRGRLSELQAPRGQGRTTLMRALVAHTLATGRWVAIVDAQRTLAPADWARLASPSPGGPGAIGTTPTPPPSRGPLPPESETSRLAVIRPADPARAPWCADVLLRSGAYALVVLDGVPALPRSTVLRLTRLAHDRQVVFLLACDAEQAAPTVGASVRLGIRIESDDIDKMSGKWRNDGSMRRSIRLVKKGAPGALDGPGIPSAPSPNLAITVTKGGPPATMRLPYVITSPRRLGCHADVPDRKGVARQTAAPPKAAGGGVVTAGISPVARSIGRVDRSPHARRAGESSYGRR